MSNYYFRDEDIEGNLVLLIEENPDVAAQMISENAGNSEFLDRIYNTRYSALYYVASALNFEFVELLLNAGAAIQSSVIGDLIYQKKFNTINLRKFLEICKKYNQDVAKLINDKQNMNNAFCNVIIVQIELKKQIDY